MNNTKQNLIKAASAVVGDMKLGKEFSAGVHSVVFDASHLANGIYFYILRAKETDFVGTKKMVVIK